MFPIDAAFAEVARHRQVVAAVPGVLRRVEEAAAADLLALPPALVALVGRCVGRLADGARVRHFLVSLPDVDGGVSFPLVGADCGEEKWEICCQGSEH